MRLFRQLVCALALGVCALSPALGDATQYADLGRGRMPVVPAYADPGFVAAALYAHNVERRLVGVPDLAWSAELAAEADRWAHVLAANEVMQHDSQRLHGENLWMNTADRRTVGSMIGGWSIEKYQYIAGARHPFESRTGHWKDVGHYTQMVWHDTTKVGCAVARGRTHDFLVCRYDPIGNWTSQMAYEPRTITTASAPASLVASR
ncbi:MAG: hypothetical protein IT548_12295 [Alphaproteobacteria bacterium]|nr:hypothetical protein [Alphaproteobacteria bacterium]